MRGWIAVMGLIGAALVPAVGDVTSAEAARKRCNGEARLCTRPFDDVVLAGAHNAMDNEADGFLQPVHARSIPEQLDAGIRALLLDVYQGTPNGSQVCTDPTPLKVAQLTRELGKPAVDQLIALRNATCPPAGGPTSGLYLCHSLCETGSTPLADTLDEIRGFLDDHPNEVIALILEDYADAGDIALAFDEAKLTRHVATHRSGAKWPTLERMIDTGKRLVVFAQRQGGTPRWLLPAFDEIQDTPYTFHSVDEFSCAPNRGPADARLLLVNHWLSAPESASAADVNTRERLLARVGECEAERGMVPNIIAVNHAEVGDLFAVVDELNAKKR